MRRQVKCYTFKALIQRLYCFSFRPQTVYNIYYWILLHIICIAWPEQTNEKLTAIYSLPLYGNYAIIIMSNSFD